MTKPTKSQADWLRYLSRPHTGGFAEISGMRDLEMADRLAERGFVRIYEKRPGFYGMAITDAGRAAVA